MMESHRTNHIFPALAVCLAALALTGCGNPVRDRVEASVAESLPDIIGPARSYSVRAYGPTFKMMSGKLDGLDITGTDVAIPNALTLSRLQVKVRDIVYDRKNSRLQRVGTTEYSATLDQAELTRYIRVKYPDVPGLGVTLRGGMVGISAKPGVSVVRVSVKANAGLEIRKQHILALNLTGLKVAGINTPGFALDYLSSKLDTIFDAGDLGLGATIKSAVVESGSLTLSGELDLMKAIERQTPEGTSPLPL